MKENESAKRKPKVKVKVNEKVKEKVKVKDPGPLDRGGSGGHVGKHFFQKDPLEAEIWSTV